jgi:DNA-binding winged helix-turn-helix (wHTH) protein/Flp pilus assembly protein TadD
MSTGEAAPNHATFGAFRFQFATLELSREGQLVPLEPQPAKVLATLLRHRDTLVSRQDLVREVWGDRFLEHDQSVNYCIRQVRAALGDSAAVGGHIRTYARRGYRFVAPVQFDSDPADSRAEAAVPPRRGVIPLATVGVLVLLLVVLVMTQRPVEQWGPAWRDVHLAAQALSTDDQVRYLTAVERLESRTTLGYRDVLRLAEEVLATVPDFVPARLQRAEALLWLGEVERARAALDSLLRAHPAEAQAHTLRGALALFRDGDARTGVRELRRGAELAPWSSEAQHYRSYAEVVAGDTASARRAIAEALRLNPLSPALDGDAGMVYYLLDDQVLADSLCRRGIEAVGPTRALVNCRMLAAEVRGDTALRDRSLARLKLLHSPHSLPGSLASDTTTARFLAAKAAAAESMLSTAPGLTELRWLVLGGRDSVVRRWIEAQPADHPLVALAEVDPLVRRAVP